MEHDETEKIERLYIRYNSLVCGVTYNILRCSEDAEDAAAQAWERILRCLDKIRDEERPETKSLIVMIAERAAIDLYRKKSKKMKVEVPLETDAFYATKDLAIENTEVKIWLHSLPKKYAEVLIEYYVNGFSQKEIGKLLGISEKAVDMRIHRGRKMLKERWMKDER